MKKDTIQIDQDEFRLNVDIYVFREGENYISYCPSLDICSSGKNFNDAVKADYWTEHGTLEADLKAHKNNLAALGVSRKEFLEFFD